MQIYNVYQSGKRLYIDEKENPDNKIACNKYESEQTTLRLISDGTLPPRLYWALRNPKLSNKYFILKLINNQDLIVGTDISAYIGLWDMLLIGTDEDYIIEGTDIDQSRLTYVSDHFGRLFVRDNFLEELDFEEQCSPTFRVFYDEIMFQLGEKADAKDIPDKMSDLENDTNFISGVALKDDGNGHVEIIGTTFSGGETEEGEIPSGGSVEVDDKLDEKSTNPVQNKVLTKEVKALQERNAELEQTIEKLQIKTTTSPSPFHHITDSAKYKVLDFGMEGKTEQKTTSGKNLFDINGDINQYYPGTIMSTNSNVLNDDGTITVNASTSASVGCGFKVEGIAGKTLTISFDVVSVGTGTGVSSSICIPTQMNYDIKSNISAGKKLVLTKTFGEDINEAIFSFITQSGTGGIIKNIQIEAGSVATEYEPFTNGSSPNPDYKQEIKNAGVYNEETGRYEHRNWVCAKNLVDENGWNVGYMNNSIIGEELSYKNLSIGHYQEIEIPRNTDIYIETLSKDGVSKLRFIYALADENNNVTFYENDSSSNTWSRLNVNSGNACKLSISILDMLPENADIRVNLVSNSDFDGYYQSTQITLTSPVPLTKWDYLTKRDGVWGWSIWSLYYTFNGSEAWYSSAGRKGFSVQCLPRTFSYRECYSNQATYFNASLGVEKSPSNSVCCGMNNDVINILMSSIYDDTLSDYGLANWKAHLNENPLEVITYADEEQSFHPLPDEEQELLNNLETYYGVTNLYNDQGCPMWIRYCCDPQLYVDQQIAKQIAQTQALILES